MISIDRNGEDERGEGEVERGGGDGAEAMGMGEGELVDRTWKLGMALNALGEDSGDCEGEDGEETDERGEDREDTEDTEDVANTGLLGTGIEREVIFSELEGDIRGS